MSAEESKTLGARFDIYWQGRVSEVVKAWAKKANVQIDTSDVITRLVKEGLPKLERMFKVKPPKEPKNEG